jgi:hypothetical protein
MLIVLLPDLSQLNFIHRRVALSLLVYHPFGLIFFLMRDWATQLFLKDKRTESWCTKVSELFDLFDRNTRCFLLVDILEVAITAKEMLHPDNYYIEL